MFHTKNINISYIRIQYFHKDIYLQRIKFQNFNFHSALFKHISNNLIFSGCIKFVNSITLEGEIKREILNNDKIRDSGQIRKKVKC